jgi:hypothetical protein
LSDLAFQSAFFTRLAYSAAHGFFAKSRETENAEKQSFSSAGFRNSQVRIWMNQKLKSEETSFANTYLFSAADDKAATQAWMKEPEELTFTFPRSKKSKIAYIYSSPTVL